MAVYCFLFIGIPRPEPVHHKLYRCNWK